MLTQLLGCEVVLLAQSIYGLFFLQDAFFFHYYAYENRKTPFHPITGTSTPMIYSIMQIMLGILYGTIFQILDLSDA